MLLQTGDHWRWSGWCHHQHCHYWLPGRGSSSGHISWPQRQQQQQQELQLQQQQQGTSDREYVMIVADSVFQFNVANDQMETEDLGQIGFRKCSRKL